MGSGKLVRSSAESVVRRAEEKATTAAALEGAEAARRLRDLASPGSPGGALKKVGVALVVAPDPVTTVAGAAMVASSYALRNRKPAGLDDLAAETRRVLRDMKSLSL